MPAQIVLNQATRPAGTAGRARSDGVVSQLVTCTNATAESSYLWTLVDVPIRSALVRGTTGTAASFTFTPDVKGTYLVSLRVNGSAASGDNDVSYFAVRSYGSKTLGWRYLAAGETTEDNETYAGLGFPSNINPRGWSTNEDLVYEEIEESVWETQNGVSTFSGVLSRLVYTDPATGRISTTLIPGSPPAGAASGDLSGTYPNPTVAAIQGRAVVFPLNPTDGQTLVWNAGANRFEPGAGGGGGVTAHGALTGLANDDHTQYLLVDGTRAMGGDLLPDGDSTRALGASLTRWNTIYVENVITSAVAATDITTGTIEASDYLLDDGTFAQPALRFASALTTGIISPESALPGVPGILMVVDGQFVGGFIQEGASVHYQSNAGSVGVPAIAIDEATSGLFSTGGGGFGLGSNATEVARIRAPSGADPQFLLADGSATAPSLSFTSVPGMGFYRTGAAIGAAFGSTLCYSFSNVGIATSVTGINFGIGHSATVSRLTLTGRMDGTTSASAFPSITLSQHASLPFVGASQAQKLVRAEAIVNQTGTSSFSALQVDVTNTALGSGAQYLADFQVGGTTVAAITNATAAAGQGRLLVSDGAATAPSLSFLTAPDTGFYSSTGASDINIATAGVRRWQFDGLAMYAQANGAVIGTAVANGTFNIFGYQTTGNTSGSILIANGSSGTTAFTGNSGSQTGTRWTYTLNQTATAGFSALQVRLTNTALGSGSHYFADFQVGTTTVAAITNGSSAADQGRFLAGDGAVATPALGFVADATAGFYRPNTGRIGVVVQGSERWRFEGSTLYAMVSGAVLRQTTTNGTLTVQGNITSATDDRAGITLLNGGMTGATGTARHVAIANTVAQSGTAGYTTLDIAITETSAGSGPGYAINVKGGAAGTTQRWALMSSGQARFVDGSSSAPAISFLSDLDSGIFYLSGVRVTANSQQIATFTTTWGGPQLNVDRGTVGIPSLACSNDPDTGLYWPADLGGNQLSVAAGGAHVASFYYNGTDPQIYAAAGSGDYPIYSFLDNSSVGLFYDSSLLAISVANNGNAVIYIQDDRLNPYSDGSTSLGDSSHRWGSAFFTESVVRTAGSLDTNAAVTSTAMCSVTANSTPVTAATIPVADGEAMSVRVTAVAIAASGAACATQKLFAVVRNSGGVLSLTQAGTGGLVDQALDATANSEKWTALFSTSGTSLLVRAQKDAGATTVHWQMTIERQNVTTSG